MLSPFFYYSQPKLLAIANTRSIKKLNLIHVKLNFKGDIPMSKANSLFGKISLESYGLGNPASAELSGDFSLEAADAQFDALASGLATSFVVFNHAHLMATAVESSDVEVSPQTTEVMEVNEMAMEAILDTLEVSIEAEDAPAEGEEKGPGMLSKAWEKIKAFFKMIGAWFAKQWSKLKGFFKGLVSKFRKSAKDGDSVKTGEPLVNAAKATGASLKKASDAGASSSDAKAKAVAAKAKEGEASCKVIETEAAKGDTATGAGAKLILEKCADVAEVAEEIGEASAGVSKDAISLTNGPVDAAKQKLAQASSAVLTAGKAGVSSIGGFLKTAWGFVTPSKAA